MKNIYQQINLALNKSNRLKKSVLFSYSFSIESDNLITLISHPSINNNDVYFLGKPNKGFMMIGLNAIKKYHIKEDLEMIDDISNVISNLEDNKIGPKILGGHSFTSIKKDDVVWGDFPSSLFIIPECLAMQENNQLWLTISTFVLYNDNINQITNQFIELCKTYKKIFFQRPIKTKRMEIDYSIDYPDKEKYIEQVQSIVGMIDSDNIKKVVLSRMKKIYLKEVIHITSIIQLLQSLYINCTIFVYNVPKQGLFFGATPEKLCTLHNKNITTGALAGTIGRNKNNTKDQLLTDLLLDSKKDNQEHQLVVEQIVHKLKTYVKFNLISKKPEIVKLNNVQHLFTPIKGSLIEKMNILELIKILHPTAAIAGVPTSKALSLIKKYEQFNRGWYAGAIGWMNQYGHGEFYVSLRSGLIKNKSAYLFAGGGIVKDSNPEDEWHETSLKLKSMLDIFKTNKVI